MNLRSLQARKECAAAGSRLAWTGKVVYSLAIFGLLSTGLVVQVKGSRIYELKYNRVMHVCSIE